MTEVVKPTIRISGTGRRKTAVARVRMTDGSGTIVVNGRPVREFFTEEAHRRDIMAPLEATEMVGKVDFNVDVNGGGPTGQAGAVVLGIARALKKHNREFDHTLRAGGFLTRDSRMKERKKYGQKGARKKFQFSKR